MAATAWTNALAAAVIAVGVVAIRPQMTTDEILAALGGGVTAGLSINLVYAALASGAMSLVAPLVACGTSLVPTAVATAIGQPPDLLQSVGIAFALLGVAAITRPASVDPHPSLSPRGLMLILLGAVAGGISFSILLLAAKDGAAVAVGVSGLSRATTLVTCLLLMAGTQTAFSVPRAAVAPIAGAGVFEASGITLLLLASTLGNAAVVAVIASFYAVVTVLLAQLVLKESIARHQVWGIAAAAVGVALLSAG